MLTQQIFSAGEEKNLWKKIEKYCTFGHYHEDYPSSTGQKGVPPHMKKNFLCRFGWIRTWKNKNKKVKKMRKVCPDPPTLLRNFLTFFFFRMNPSLRAWLHINNYDLFNYSRNTHWSGTSKVSPPHGVDGYCTEVSQTCLIFSITKPLR